VNLAIIIPARNEAGCIQAVLQRIPAGLAQQVLVVDNGSTDGTAAVAARTGAQVIPEPRRGYGQACLTGLAHLRDEIDTIAILDADGSDDPRMLLKLLPLDGTDFVVSARTLGLAKQNLSPQQRFGNWLACFLIRWLWSYRFRDLGPLRVIRRDALARLAMRDTTWGWNVEMQIKAIERSLRIRQVDVPYGHRIAGTSKISGTITGTIRAGWKILSTIAKLRYESRFADHHGPVSDAGQSQNATGARHR
jgi:glycosyltransferase involved in cell wall biosynthesis